MIKKGIIGLLIIFYIVPLFAKQFKIGSILWYNEDIEFTKILKISQANNKPIIIVFSAKWCRPCKAMKKTVFKSDEFKKISQKYILQYIEETTDKGKAYIKQFNVSAFPSIKVFNKDGFEIIKTIKGYRSGLIKTLLNIKTDKHNYSPLEEISRYNAIKKYKQAILVSQKHIKEKKVKLSNIKYYFELTRAYLSLKQYDKAINCRDKINEYLKNKKITKIDLNYVKMNILIIKTIMKSKKNVTNRLVKETINMLKNGNNFEYFKSALSEFIKLGIDIDYTLEVINGMIKNEKNDYKSAILLNLKAKTYAKKGDIKKSEEIFNKIIDTKENQNLFVLGQIVDSMLEVKIINNHTLKAAKIVVGYYKIPETYKLLADVYTELKDYTNAINTLNEAKKSVHSKDDIIDIDKSIKKLKLKAKNFFA